MSPFASLST
eukprot:jgi/Chrpa1/21392/Chrysochromulina_OHIO_Genome00020751-RA